MFKLNIVLIMLISTFTFSQNVTQELEKKDSIYLDTTPVNTNQKDKKTKNKKQKKEITFYKLTEINNDSLEIFHDTYIIKKIISEDLKIYDLINKFENYNPNKCVFVPEFGVSIKEKRKKIDYIFSFTCGTVVVYDKKTIYKKDFWNYKSEIKEIYEQIFKLL